MPTIGLLAAMPSESSALLHLLPAFERINIGGFRAARFETSSNHCILLTSGMGMENAGRGARLLIDSFHPDVLVSFGIAGAVRPDLQIGDVVMAERSARLENGAPASLQLLFSLPADTVEKVRHTLETCPAHLLNGTALTTRGSQWLEPSQELPNPILEMETEGIRPVAVKAALPLLVIRSISDGPLAPVPINLEKAMDANYHLRPAQLLLQVLKRPRILLQANSMLRNSRLVADHAALAVSTLLNLPII